MVLNREKIEALAPDPGTLDAAGKLLKPAIWPCLACDGAGLVWGEAQGSAATPYRVVFSEIDAGFKCTCASRKFPCKHGLALMRLRAEGKADFAVGTPPDWVEDWRSRRRPPGRAATEATGSVLLDPKAAAQRERTRRSREAAIDAVLDEVEVWLSDQIERGMGAFLANAVAICRQLSRRLVDAKAAGLAARLDNLPSRLFALDEAGRPAAAVEELGALVLIAAAWRRRDDLEPGLAGDVRQEVAGGMTRDAVLAAPDAVRVEGSWQVIATRTTTQPDKLRRMETWLWRLCPGEAPRPALLVDFVPASVAMSAGRFVIGDRFDAELVYTATPLALRAVIAAQTSPATGSLAGPDLPDTGLTQAYDDYEQALAARPWLTDWPLLFRGARLRRHGEICYLTDTRDPGLALPLWRTQTVTALPLLGVGTLDGVGLWDGRRLRLAVALTGQGRWTAP